MYYVYVLECQDGSLYAGMTNDLRRRMALHAAGKGAKYTRSHPPRALAGLWRWPHRSKRRRYSLRWRNMPASRCGM